MLNVLPLTAIEGFDPDGSMRPRTFLGAADQARVCFGAFLTELVPVPYVVEEPRVASGVAIDHRSQSLHGPSRSATQLSIMATNLFNRIMMTLDVSRVEPYVFENIGNLTAFSFKTKEFT